jgi:RNA polymerase sigma-70 factor (ECF subfamily)
MHATVPAVLVLPESLSLVSRLQEADPAALSEVYAQHAGALLGFAKRLVGDPQAAEDLVHEVFMAVPKAMRGYQGTASLRTFLFSIAVNHARHHVRSASRRRALATRFGREPEARVGTPEQDAQRERLSRALSLSLDTLPLDQRVAFVLCEVEERSSKEVAEIVGAPEGTVRTRLFHAKQKLRSELEKRGVR